MRHTKKDVPTSTLITRDFMNVTAFVFSSVIAMTVVITLPILFTNQNILSENIQNVSRRNASIIYNYTIIEPPTTLDMLSNVVVTNIQNGNVLKYIGGEWINGPLGSVSIDLMQIQARILGVCPAQNYIREILENGTVVCGNSLSNDIVGSSQIIDGSITDEDVDKSLIQLRVNGNCLGNGNYMKSILENGTVECSTLNAFSSVGSAEIVDGSITASDIDSTSVQERVIGVCSVLGESIISIASNGTVICSGSVAVDSVGTNQLMDGAVINSKIGIGAVNSISILNNSIAEDDMSAPYKIGVPNGIVPLDSNGLISSLFLPPISITTVTVCANISCRDAVSPIQTGDVVKVLDSDGSGNPNTYIWDGSVFQSIMVPLNNLALNDLLNVDAPSPLNGQVLAYNNLNSKWEPTSSMASSDTASNLGIGGQGLFSSKVSNDFQFYSLSAASSKLTIATPNAGLVALDVVSSNILHGDLGSIPANQHVDHSTIVLTGSNGITIDGGASGDLTASRTIALSAGLSQLSDVSNMLMPLDKQILEYDNGSGMWVAADQITGANVGTGSGHVFISKVGNELQFRQIAAGSARVSVTNNMNNVQIDVQEGSVDHDALLNYVGAEHVSHTSVLLGVANGLLIDGGSTSLDISASRTLSVNTSVIQARIVGLCSPGSSIRAIDEAGAVTCEVDSIGGGIVGPGTTADNSIVVYDGTDGTTVKGSFVHIDSMGAVSNATSYNGVSIDTVQITGGIGLTNSGTSTLETHVQIDLDINSLPTLLKANVHFDEDMLLVYDTSLGIHYKMPFADLPLMETPAMGEFWYFDLTGTLYTLTTLSATTTGLDNLLQLVPVTTFSPGPIKFTSLSNGILQYTGTAGVYCHTAASISISASSNIDLVAAIAVNNTIQVNSRVEFRASSNNIHSTALHAYIPLAQNDQMSIYMGSVSGVTTISVRSVNLFAMCKIHTHM